MSRLQTLIDQTRRTRQYTLLVLDHVDPARWFEMPAGCPSHVAWQVGHLAFAQAIHTFRTVAGMPTLDPLPAGWQELFGKGSSPSPDAVNYSSRDEILAGAAAVFDRSIDVLTVLPDAVLDEPASHATGMVNNKLDLLYWVVRHEMLHTGQIGLIRRLLNEAPYR